MRTSFGRLHGRNPEFNDLAKKTGRSPGAVAMKTSIFASLDPNLDRKGLSNAGLAAEAVWNEFAGNPTKLALEADLAAKRFGLLTPPEAEIELPTGLTQKHSLVKVRLVQPISDRLYSFRTKANAPSQASQIQSYYRLLTSSLGRWMKRAVRIQRMEFS